jgi:hypothetical protein
VNAICRSAGNFASGETSEFTDHPPERRAHFGQIGHDEARRPRKRFILNNSAALMSAAESECLTAIHMPLRACAP